MNKLLGFIRTTLVGGWAWGRVSCWRAARRRDECGRSEVEEAGEIDGDPT